MGDQTSPSVSRRSFIGMLTALPAVVGGFLVPFGEDARADELGVEPADPLGPQAETNASSGFTTIVIAKSDEVGIVVADIADGGRKPVAGADVQLTSRSNKKVVSGKTDAKGIVLLKIDQLVDKEKDASGSEIYRGYVKLSIECKGYRKYHTGCVSIEGGRGIMAPTRSTASDKDLAYPILVTLDEWDILYTNNCFAATRANDMEHTLRVELATTMPSAKVSLVSKAGDKIVSGNLTTKNGEGSVEFKELFLMRFHRRQLPIGKDFTLLVEGDRGSYSFPLAMEVTEAVTQATAPGTSKILLSPFWPSGNGEKPSFTFPKSWGFIGGEKINIILPEANFDFFYDPFGYVRIGYRSDDFSREAKYVRSIDGNKTEKDNEWKRHPRKSFQEQMEKAAADRDAMKKKVGTAIHSRTGSKVQNVEMSRTIAGKLSFSCAAAGKMNEQLWRMNAFAELLFAFNFSHSQQLVIGPIPAVVEYGVMMSAALALNLGIASPDMMDPTKYTFDYGSSGITLTLVIAPSLSLGVGIKGLLSASLKGSVSLSATIAMRKSPPDGMRELKNPNLIFGAQMQVDVVLQALIFTKSFKVFSLGDPELYNNWKGGLKSQADDLGLLPQADVDFGEFFDGASIITEADLEQVIEFSEDEDLELEADADADVDALGGPQMISRQVEMFTEDGEPYLCTIFELVTRIFQEGTASDAGHDATSVGANDAANEVAAGDAANGELVAQDGDAGGLMADTVANADGSGTLTPQAASATLQGEGMASDAGYEQDASQDEASAGVPADAVVVDAATFESLRTQAVGVDEDGALLVPYADEVVWDEAARLKQFRPEDKGHDYAHLVDSDKPSFSRVASNVGLVPSPESDMCIAKNVFSDPRPEVESINGVTYIFRIATVKIANGATRSRIVYQKVNGGKAGPENVLDYKIDYKWDKENLINKDDLYVYDFDIAVSQARNEHEVTTLMLFAISGRRAHGDKTTFGQAACDQVFTLASFVVLKDEFRLDKTVSYVTNSATDFDAAGGGKDYPYHSFCCPHVEFIQDTLGGRPYFGYLLTYLDRAGRTPEEAVGKDARTGIGCIIDNGFVFRIASFADIMKKKVGNLGGGIYEMVCNKRIRADEHSGWSLVMLRGREGDNTTSRHILIKTTVASKMDQSLSPVPSVLEVSSLRTDVGGKAQGEAGAAFEALRLVDWPKHEGEFLASKDGKLKRVKLTGLNTSSPTLGEFVPCGPDKFNVNGFGIDPTGSVVYWPAAGNTNPGYSYDNEGKARENTGSPINVVLASRLHGSTFSDPFVYAEVKHDMQAVQVLEHFDPSKLALISVDMSNAQRGSSDIWFTLIPRVKCANIIGCTPVTPFAYPGEKAEFEVTVRNDGNTYLSGLTAQLRLKGSNGVVSESRLDFTKDTIRASSLNPQGANGKLEGVEDDFSLAPGKASVYSVKLTIPKDWANEKEVTITAKDATIAQDKGSSVKAQADDDLFDDVYDDGYVEEYIVDSDEDWEYADRPSSVLDIWYEDEVDDEWEEDYFDSPMTSVDPNGNGANNGNGGGNNNGNGNGGDSGNGSSGSGSGTGGTGSGIGWTGTPYGGPSVITPYGSYATPGPRGVAYTGPGYGNPPAPAGVSSTATGGAAPLAGGAGTTPPVAGTTYAGAVSTPATGGMAGAASPVTSGAAAATGAPQAAQGTAGAGVAPATSLAATSDASAPSGVPLALGLAGAAMLAYSRRRERMEREGRGDDTRARHEDD